MYELFFFVAKAQVMEANSRDAEAFEEYRKAIELTKMPQFRYDQPDKVLPHVGMAIILAYTGDKDYIEWALRLLLCAKEHRER